MIPFRRQLRVLLWKAVKIKQRQKLWLVVELLVPMILFLTLVMIRLTDLTTTYPLCHYNSRAFPSAGLAPFLNGFLCSFTNPCASGPTTGDEAEELNLNQTSLIVEGIRAFAAQLEVIGSDPAKFNKTITELGDLIHLLANGNSSVVPIEFHQLFSPGVNVSGELQGLGLSKALAQNLSIATLTPGFFLQLTKESARFKDLIGNPMNAFSIHFFQPFPLLCNATVRDASFRSAGGREPAAANLAPEDEDALCALTPQRLYSEFLKENKLLTAVNTDTVERRILPLTSKGMQGALAGATLFGHPLFDFIRKVLSMEKNDILKAATCGQNFGKATGGSQAKVASKGVPRSTPLSRVTTEIFNYVNHVHVGTDSKQEDIKCFDVPILNSTHCPLKDIALLSQFMPVLTGRIVVAPDSPVTRKLVEKLNDPLRHYAFFASLFPDLSQIAAPFVSALNRSDVPTAMKVAADLLHSSGNASESARHAADLLDQARAFIEASTTDEKSAAHLLQTAAGLLTNVTECMLADRFVIVANETFMEDMALCLQAHNQYFSGIVIHNVTANSTTLPEIVLYRIRHLNSIIDSTRYVEDGPARKTSRDDPFVDLKYVTFGFSYLQEAVERAITEMQAKLSAPVGVYSQQEPYPCVVEDEFNVAPYVALFALLSWMIPTAMLVKNVVYEKQQRLKEIMRIMGLGDAVHFVSWAAITFVINIFPIIGISAMLSYGRIMPFTSASLLMVFLAFFSAALIAQALFLTTLFTNANMATACTCIFYFLSFFPHQLTSHSATIYTHISFVLPQSALGYGLMLLSFADSDKRATWKHFSDIVYPDSRFEISLAWVLGMFAIDVVGYTILAWYISAVHPGVHGVSQPWYFPFTRRYWCSSKCIGDSSFSPVLQAFPENDAFEKDPLGEKMTVMLSGLSKEYSNGMRALDGLNLRMYESQITGLLGHNGAGKSTTMSILCGLFSPSAGTAIVYGADLRDDMRAIRDTLGFCPQHNVLFDMLTVFDQLYFFAALKGVPFMHIKNEVTECMASVSLNEKADTLAMNLSGGQKRRLSIAIALVGGSKFVILDEPTAGVDVNSRKEIWRLLTKSKEGRTILLSTHHMDEADVLSDRIAILSEGKLKALGSSIFLKNRFGRSLTLTAIKAERKCDAAAITKALNELSDKVKVTLEDENDDELELDIPIETETTLLEDFFRKLHQAKTSIGIRAYGVSAPSLQDIFISVAPQKEIKLNKAPPTSIFGLCRSRKRRIKNAALTAATAEERDEQVDETALTEGAAANTAEKLDEFIDAAENGARPSPSVFRQAYALLAVRGHYTNRSLPILFFEIALPLLLLVAAEAYISLNTRNPAKSEEPIRPLILDNIYFLNKSDTYISLVDQNESSVSARVAGEILTESGMSVRCQPNFNRDEDDSFCYQGAGGNLTIESLLEDNKTAIPYNIVLNKTCDCTLDGYTCTMEDYPTWDLPRFGENTTDKIMDMSFRNISQMRIITHDALDIYNETTTVYFTGGLSLGHRNRAAANESALEQRASGWPALTKALKSLASVVKMNLSTIPSPKPGNDSEFYKGITMDNFVKRVVYSLDANDNIKLWFNNKRWPSLPIYTNALSNALMRISAGNSTYSPGIMAIQQPMNKSMTESIEGNTNQNQMRMLFRILLLMLALSVITGSRAVFLVEERISECYHLQLVSGLSRPMYWIIAYVSDMAIYLVAACLVQLIYLTFDVREMSFNAGAYFSLTLLYVVFGLASLPIVYLLQRVFTVPAIAFVFIAIGTFFVGIVTTMVVGVLELFIQQDPTLGTAYDVCSTVFLILVPSYNLGMGVLRATTVYSAVMLGEVALRALKRPDLIGTIPYPSVLEWDFMGRHLVVLSIQGILAWLVIAVCEHGSIGITRRVEQHKTRQLVENEDAEQQLNEDKDVTAERDRVIKIGEAATNGDYGLVVRSLAKAFDNNLIVKEVSFVVERGECFGLLGLNGAGKTTTFGMMTGKHDIGVGQVFVNGEEVTSRHSDGFRSLGYCPQFDALNMKLTTRENVVFFARIHGIAEGDIPKLTTSLLRSLHLLPYADIRAAALSGGNRRKLSVAVALISQPPVIMLDEPSAGMDPSSQQFLWSVVTRLRKSGRAVVLTSHSMEECEALCTRIAILDRGRIRCIGSKQHLKSKYGEGLSLSLKMASPKEAKLAVDFVKDALPKANVAAIHCSAVFFRIPNTAECTIHQILAVVNRLKLEYIVEDFSLSQTTLDEIFQCLSEQAAAATPLAVTPGIRATGSGELAEDPEDFAIQTSSSTSALTGEQLL